MSLFYTLMASGGSIVEDAQLTGTTGSPNVDSDTATDPADAEVGWHFLTDGTIEIEVGPGSNTFFANWNTLAPTPATDYWMRITANAGDAHTTGISTGSWLKIAGTSSADREFSWRQTTVGILGPGSVKVEISTSATGTPIVATGYYGCGIVQVEL